MPVAPLVLVLVLALPLPGCATPAGRGDAAPAASAQPAPDTAVASGADRYRQYCASCHGVDGRGGGPAAETLRTPPADLTRLSERWGTPLDRAALAELIDGRKSPRAHGPSDMPVWGERLYAGERPDSPAREAARRGTILLILEYLETLQRAPEAPAGATRERPGRPAAGATPTRVASCAHPPSCGLPLAQAASAPSRAAAAPRAPRAAPAR